MKLFEIIKIDPIKIDTKLQYHDTLNPKIWDENSKLFEDIKEHLLDIGYAFCEFIKLDRKLITDMILTGSNANYNWTSQSDLDLHIVADLTDLKSNYLDEYLQAKKGLWSTKHKITIHGYDVELYTQDKDADLAATGIYSLLKDDWVLKPEHLELDIDNFSVQTKAAAIMEDIDALVEERSTDDIDELITKAQAVKDKIKKMRKAGLEAAGEFGTEALAFKALRNNGYLEKLSDLIQDLQDRKFSLP